jgi:hypothetical protein
MGPILIFDKSLLQSLNPDESALLDHFFLCNITPIFFIETLGDLEKEMRSGRTPEEVVGQLAYKTPDWSSAPNAHHANLLAAELLGLGEVVMDGRIVRAQGRAVQRNGKFGIIYEESDEEQALSRWQRGEFLVLERKIAKQWREALAAIDFQPMYDFFQKYYKDKTKPHSLTEAKQRADAMFEEVDRVELLLMGLSLLGVPRRCEDDIRYRFGQEAMPPLREFAPYFSYVLSLELFFYLAMAADLIPRTGKSHKLDFLYLYYLPFCMVFTSCDHIHISVAPLFLRSDQTFVPGSELKNDLRKLNDHYSELPEDVQREGLIKFAKNPPSDTSFLVTRLWDKHASKWRKQHEEERMREPLSKAGQDALLELVTRFEKESVNTSIQPRPEQVEQMLVRRSVSRQKGRWLRVSPDVK